MIITDAVRGYLSGLRHGADPVLAEMEAQAHREGVPIVVPETGALLQVLTLARAPRRVVEIGTAIGVSTLYMARGLPPDGTIVSFEIDPSRHRDAAAYLERAGLGGRVELHLQDAREGLRSLGETFDMAFIDGVKGEYGEYLELLLPLLGERALLVVDNVLMSGTVAEGHTDGHWTDEQIATARAFNEQVLSRAELEGTVTPVGDGVLVAVRR